MRTFAAALLCAALALAQPAGQRGPSPQLKAVMAAMGHGEGRLQPGDRAPDFKIRKLRAPGKVRLSSFRGRRPVLLVFGSYT